jgi:mRNA-capping enzyme
MGRDLASLFPTGGLGFNIVPAKTPLGRRFARAVPPDKSFTPADAFRDLQAKGKILGLVLDLTNTGRYYDPAEWGALGVAHQKVYCPPRGQTPHPSSVNHFTFELLRFFEASPDKYVLVHCTHGFNRTGYMLASWLARRGAARVAGAVRAFASLRPPGIYKEAYLADLFRYNHEARPAEAACPAVPAFKAGEPDSPRRDGDEGADPAAVFEPSPVGADVGPDVDHDTPFGEAVHPEEEARVQAHVFELITGRALRPHERPHFPGSQPVSLDRANMALLTDARYAVTWKADGTRYLVYALPWGAYLLDRAFGVVRVQARFPTRPPPGSKHLVGPPHMGTLLDGEMVVDEDVATGARTRRFLAYDLVALNGARVADRPFDARHALIESDVVRPRTRERDAAARRAPGATYQYEGELFRLRRKEFWPLAKAAYLLDRFIPALSHESDGLILQPADDAYVPGTCPQLLKWKFAHLNSVDFKLRVDAAGDKTLLLLETRKDKEARGLVPLAGASVDVAGVADERALSGKIVECAWDAARACWVGLRVRPDKDEPNAVSTYEKVMKSITDNVREADLLEEVERALKAEPYAARRKEEGATEAAAAAAVPAPAPPAAAKPADDK